VRSVSQEPIPSPGDGADLFYRYPVERLISGAAFGNFETFLKLTPHSDVASLWSALDDQSYCGRWITHVFVRGERATARETTFAPAYQGTAYSCAGLAIEKRTFLPMRGDALGTVYQLLDMENPDDEPVDVAVMCDLHFPAFVWPGMYKVPDQAQRMKRVRNEERNGLIVSSTVGDDNEVRVFGSTMEPVATYMGERGFSRTFRLTIGPHERARASITLAISDKGVRAAVTSYRKAPDGQTALGQAQAFYRELNDTARVRTPDPIINRAYDWAKINSVRVQHRFPAGFGFTNDPSQDIVVVRDAAWYIMGSDYITPEFSRDMLDMIAEHGIEPGGKITEFIRACTDPPQRSDYDLNINDDTPLIVAAVYHHYAIGGDRASLERCWPMVRGACDWIIAQVHGGLVHSHSQEANVWGIAGWRNIIPQGQISGAVTEINSECAYALRLGARLALDAGEPDLAQRYATLSETLRRTINKRLVSERNGLYVLNIDPDGEAHHDLTGDQIFPVLFGVADDERKRRILDLLATPEFWTPFGVRTVGKHQDEYDPDYGVGLLGGIWPNLTAWVAYCNKTYSPRRLVAGMRNIWKISEVENPRAYHNVVPGLFPERLSGETFKSRGMAMSPWMPPTYVWLTFEGLLGFEPTADGLRVNPHLPSDWKWVGARDVPVRGRRMSFFYHRRTLHTTLAVQSRSKCQLFDDDVTHHVESDAPFVLALRDAERTVVFVGTADPGLYRVTLKPPLVPAEQVHEVPLRAGDAKLLTVKRTP
jgi:hypothetical protein